MNYVFVRESHMYEDEAVKNIGIAFGIDFNEAPFDDYVKSVANMEAYYDRKEKDERSDLWEKVQEVNVDGVDYYVYVF